MGAGRGRGGADRPRYDIVKAGKARYVGASSMYAWQFAKAQHAAERNGWTPFHSMQDHYNLIYREEEREAATELTLSEREIERLAEPYRPHPILGH